MKKIISMILVICLLTVSTVWTASAYDNNIEDVNVDGYNITINENTGDETVVSTFVDGVKYQITFDKDANDFEMITNEYAAYIFGIGIGACNEEIYDVDVENLDEDGIEAEIISEDTEDVTRISDDMVEYKLPWLLQVVLR